jgi:hypothetical protein
VLRQPLNSGSNFYNYKGTFSIVLMAVVDSQYRFLFLDIGKQGRISDGGVFGSTALRRALDDKSLNIPDPAPLPGDDQLVDFFMVGDEAFPLRKYLMKPFPSRNLTHAQRVYNYRLSRARRIVENAFGIMANRFRVFLKPMLVSTSKAELVVLAACTLHNMLCDMLPAVNAGIADREDTNTHQITPGQWRSDQALQKIDVMRGNNATLAAKAQRDYLCEFVNSDAGRVEWQDRAV